MDGASKVNIETYICSCKGCHEKRNNKLQSLSITMTCRISFLQDSKYKFHVALTSFILLPTSETRQLSERTYTLTQCSHERTYTLTQCSHGFPLKSDYFVWGNCKRVEPNIFLKHADFEDTFCEYKMIARGITRSLIECASLCSLNVLCTGFFYDDGKYCFLTEEHMSDENHCSFQKGHYYTNLGMFILYLK